METKVKDGFTQFSVKILWAEFLVADVVFTEFLTNKNEDQKRRTLIVDRPQFVRNLNNRHLIE